MYSDERSEKSTGTTARTLARPCRIWTVVRVSSFSSSWTSRSDSTSCSKQACSYTWRPGIHRRRRPVRRARTARRVGGHRQVRVVRAVPDEREERQDAGPSPEAVREVAAARGGPFEPFQQAVQPVALVVEGVVAGQQIA